MAKRKGYEYVCIEYRYPVLRWPTIQANVFTEPEMLAEVNARAMAVVAERNAAFLESLDRIYRGE